MMLLRGSGLGHKVGRARRSAPTFRRTALRGREKAKAAREALTQIRLSPVRFADKVGALRRVRPTLFLARCRGGAFRWLFCLRINPQSEIRNPKSLGVLRWMKFA